jgi:hypothetical protein
MTPLPLIRILIKLFAIGFYRVHAGLLALLFGTVICYCIFIIPLNETHLAPAQRIVESLIFTLSLLSSPIMMLFVFIVWFIYTYKSWQYIQRQLQLESNLFIFYSVTSFSTIKQFQSWAVVQTVILLPAIMYALMTLVVGIIFGYYIAPFVVMSYIFLLVLISAGVYMRVVNRLAHVTPGFVLQISRHWTKPSFSLFLYHIADQLKLTYLVVKVMSLLGIASLFYFFTDIQNLRAAAIIMLLVCLAHTVFAFRDFRFQQVYLGFMRNFPISRVQLYINVVLLYILLLLPEGIALLVSLPVFTALLLFLFTLGMLVLFRCTLQLAAHATMRSYLWSVTGISVLVFILILLNAMEFIALLNLPLTCFIFYKRYYNAELLTS